MLKTNKILLGLFKVFLLFVLLYVLYLQLNFKKVSLSDLSSVFLDVKLEYFVFGICAIILMPFNWFLESYKWQALVTIVQEKFTFLNSIKAVLLGVFFGFVTPNRVGEFGGRLFNIDSGKKVKALNLSFVGGIAQFVVTFLFGLAFTFPFLNKEFELNDDVFGIGYLIIFFITIVFFLNLKQITTFLLPSKLFKSFAEKYVFNFQLKSSFLLKILAISVLRYCVYVFQYIAILYFLGIQLELFFLFQVICTMLLIQTIVPSFSLIDLGIRGNILLFLLGNYVENQLLILVAVLLVWILNLVIPAIVGYYYFVQLKLEVKNEKSINHINIVTE